MGQVSALSLRIKLVFIEQGLRTTKSLFEKITVCRRPKTRLEKKRKKYMLTLKKKKDIKPHRQFIKKRRKI